MAASLAAVAGTVRIRSFSPPFAGIGGRGRHPTFSLSQPIARPLTAPGGDAVTRRDILGDIVHEYARAA